MKLPPMKISDRLRHGAKGAFFVAGGDADNMLEAAAMLDECEKVLRIGLEVTETGWGEGIGRWQDDVRISLSRLRAQERG